MRTSLTLLLLLAVSSIRAQAVGKNFDKCSEICQIPFLLNGRLHFECTTESPIEGDLFGRCPTRLLNQNTREASNKAEDWVKCGKSCPFSRYTGNKEIENHFRYLVSEFPSLASVVEVGQSSLGQNIVGIRISRGVQEQRELLKPMVRYSGNMHGNEPIGREILNHFAEVLLRGYGRVDEITELLNTTDITLIPTINPDGFDRAEEGACSGADYRTGRYNEGRADLNRDFPTWRDVNETMDSLYANRQPETQAMMTLVLAHPWVLSANFHDGAVVASYPYDDYRDGQPKVGIHKTPDHDFFRHLASSYATNHLTMMDPFVCSKWWFENGITNGADWYALTGGLEDFNYLFSNDMEITLELSCCKYPKKYYLNREWERNRDSLMSYIQQVHRGVKGVVRDSAGESVENAVIMVEDLENGINDKKVTTSSRGEYWKLLMPGKYLISAYYNACQTGGLVLISDKKEVDITEENKLVVMDIVLDDGAPCTTNPR